MADQREIKVLFDATAYDKNGDKLGSIKEIYVDDQDGQPTFVEVGHGLFGMSSSLVPVRGGRLENDELHLAFSKDRIKDAPSLDADRNLSSQQQEELYRHYGVEGSAAPSGFTGGQSTERTGTTAGQGAAAGAGVGAAGAGAAAGANRGTEKNTTEQKSNTQAAQARGNAGEGEDIVLSEERLNVDKERVATGEARLRKYVVEDTETVEVPVTHEEVRLERTPISDEEAAKLKGTDTRIGDSETSITLHEERVNVSKEEVPVERVNLTKEQVRDTEKVSETVRKEELDTEGFNDKK